MDSAPIAPSTDASPDTTTNTSVLVASYKGQLYDSNSYTFKDGQLVLNKDGMPKKKAGRKQGTKNKAKASPPTPASAQAPAPAPEPEAPSVTTVAVAPVQTTQAAVAVVKEVTPPTVAVVAPPTIVVAGTKPAPATVPVQVASPPPPAPVQAPPAPLPVVVVGTQPAPVTKPVSPAPKQAEETVVTVTRTVGKFGKLEQQQDTLDVRTFVTDPAKVELGYGLTVSLGDYEFARVDVKVSIPCYREEVDATYAQAKSWVEERIKAEVKDVRSATMKKPNNPF